MSNMMFIKKNILALGLFVVGTGIAVADVPKPLAMAQEKAPSAKDTGWKSTAELGIVVTSGDTKTSTYSGKFDASRDVEKWRYSLHAETLSASSNSIKSAEKYLASGQTDYKFSKHNYMFGYLEYDKDLFSGYQYQTVVAAGYGRRLLSDDAMTLDLEVGPGIRTSKIDLGIDPNAKAENNAVLRVAAKYRWQLSATSKFSEDLTTEASHKSTISKSVTGLTAKVNSSLAMKMTVTLMRTTHVPVGTRENDTETAVTLVYSF